MEGDDDDAQNRGMDILASGRKMEDREEVVRMVVRRWGILHGNGEWRPAVVPYTDRKTEDATRRPAQPLGNHSTSLLSSHPRPSSHSS